MIKAIVFDLDNTLVDFMRMKDRAIEGAVKAMIDAGLDFSYADIKKKIDEIYKERGIEYQQVFDILLNKLIGKIDHKILSSGIVAYRTAREAELNTYPKVVPTLISLIKLGIKLGVVSDAPGKEAWLRLCYLNFHHLFDAVVTYDDTGMRKPNPEPFQKVMDMLKIQPAEALMVGDWAERDVLGAAQVGMKTVFARYGNTFGTEISNADYDIDDITQVISIVKDENRKEQL